MEHHNIIENPHENWLITAGSELRFDFPQMTTCKPTGCMKQTTPNSFINASWMGNRLWTAMSVLTKGTDVSLTLLIVTCFWGFFVIVLWKLNLLSAGLGLRLYVGLICCLHGLDNLFWSTFSNDGASSLFYLAVFIVQAAVFWGGNPFLDN